VDLNRKKHHTKKCFHDPMLALTCLKN
jgi:hypothetical protein